MHGSTVGPPYIIGSSLKMYLDQRTTLRWVEAVADIARAHPAVVSGTAGIFLMPSFLAVAPSLDLVADGVVRIGAQDMFWMDTGAYTGEVSGAHLAEIGCSLVELGHAERRRIFGETDEMVSAKMVAAYRNELVPVLCLGEEERVDPESAGRECVRQLDAALRESRSCGSSLELIVAYEPQWAIGAVEPARPEYVHAVVGHIRRALAMDPQVAGSAVIYGGSAGPGLLTALDGCVDGLFLGRSGHDPEAFRSILDEVYQLHTGSAE